MPAATTEKDAASGAVTVTFAGGVVMLGATADVPAGSCTSSMTHLDGFVGRALLVQVIAEGQDVRAGRQRAEVDLHLLPSRCDGAAVADYLDDVVIRRHAAQDAVDADQHLTPLVAVDIRRR